MLGKDGQEVMMGLGGKHNHTTQTLEMASERSQNERVTELGGVGEEQGTQ